MSTHKTSTHKMISAMLAGLVLQGCADEATAPPPKPRGVLFEQVSTVGAESSSIYSGVTQAHLDARLSFKVPGTVVERPVSVGDRVESGDLLARLDERDYTSAALAAAADLTAAEAKQRQAEANYERVISLYENRNASQAELELARAEAEASKATSAAAREQRRHARLRLSYTRLKAPEQCEVAETPIKVDENVDAGTPVVRLTCGECPEVKVNIPQTQIQLVKHGMPVAVTVASTGTSTHAAVVSEVGVATESGATFPVTAIFTGACPNLRSGIAADVRFRFTNGNGGRITVPSVAVGEDDNGRFVFVLQAQGDDLYSAHRRTVEVGEFTENARFVITSGLENGELITTAGVRRIQDGQTVRLSEGLRS